MKRKHGVCRAVQWQVVAYVTSYLQWHAPVWLWASMASSWRYASSECSIVSATEACRLLLDRREWLAALLLRALYMRCECSVGCECSMLGQPSNGGCLHRCMTIFWLLLASS